MTVKPMDSAERSALLRDIAAAQQRYDDARTQRDSAACTLHFDEVKRLRDRYYERLPRLCMAVCPVCAKPLYRRFDPFGFDGPWWSDAPAGGEPPACPHFVLLRGAVAFHNLPAFAGAKRVHTGPEVPYVIPRLLDLDGMVMTIGTLTMEPGFTAYPLVYFAPRRPAPSDLTSTWARPTFEYRNAAGDGGWEYASDAWDFDLAPWLPRGKIRWCDPGSNNSRLSADPPDRCPFLNLPGERQAVEIEGAMRHLTGVPDGQPNFPID